MRIHLLLESVTSQSFKAVFVIGVPGSGKSTVLQQAKSKLPSDTVFVNPDAPIERGDLIGNELEARKYAQLETEDSVTDAVNETRPLVIESTPAAGNKLINRIVHLIKIGYDVTVILIKPDVSEEELLQRIERRGREVESTRQYFKQAVEAVNVVAGTLQSMNVPVVVKTPSEFPSAITSVFSTPLKNPKGRKIKQEMNKRGISELYPELMSERDYQYLNSFWYSK